MEISLKKNINIALLNLKATHSNPTQKKPTPQLQVCNKPHSNLEAARKTKSKATKHQQKKIHHFLFSFFAFLHSVTFFYFYRFIFCN